MDLLLIDVFIAYILDLIFGDPHWAPHPVRFIGNLIRKLDKLLLDSVRKKYSLDKEITSGLKKAEILAGFWLTLFVVLITTGLIYLILNLSALLSIALFENMILFHIVNIYFIYTSLATKCLGNEGMKIHNALRDNDITTARKFIGYLVSRETDSLNEEKITKATVETVAENTVDGVTSPLFYCIVGCFFSISAPLVYLFKAISTLDSMVGYKNERYINFGMISAKFDDLLNYIPARITGLLLVVSAFFLKLDYKNSFLVLKRDRRNHKSPNCAYPESAVAGALGIQLGGKNVYFGKLLEKPTIGDAINSVSYIDIKRSVHLMYICSFLSIGLFAFVYYLFV